MDRKCVRKLRSVASSPLGGAAKGFFRGEHGVATSPMLPSVPVHTGYRLNSEKTPIEIQILGVSKDSMPCRENFQV